MPLLELASFLAGIIIGAGFTLTIIGALGFEPAEIRSSPSPSNDDEEAWNRLLQKES